MCRECKSHDIAAELCSFSSAIKSYLPEKYSDILEDGWTSSHQYYTGCSGIEEFMSDVKSYVCFPGSHKYFDMVVADPLPSMVRLHQSLKDNTKYIYKQDMLNMMQLIVNKLNLHDHQKFVVTSAIGVFLKTGGLVYLEGIAELIPYPGTSLLDFSEQLQEKVKNTEPTYKLIDSTNYNEILGKLEEILCIKRKSPESESLLKMIENCRVQPTNLDFFERCISWISVIIEEIKGFMNYQHNFFLPKRFGENFIPTVRVFDDRKGRKFVLIHELWREMKVAKLDTSKIESDVVLPELKTEDFETIRDILADDFEKITFVTCTIANTSRRTHFIPSLNGKFCFKTSNFLLEIIRELITVHGCFQNLNATHWNMLTPLFDELANRLERESNGCLLIETQAALRIKKWMLKETAEIFVCRPKKIKEIRPIREDWFTVRDVINELKRLGINESFGHRIESDLINKIYNLVTNRRDVDVHPSRHFYDVLGMIQAALVISKFQKILHLIHNCGDCHNLFLKCIFCDGSPLSSGADETAEKKSEKKKEKKKRQAEKKKLAKEEKNASPIQVEQVPEVSAKEEEMNQNPDEDLESDLSISDQSISQEPVKEPIDKGSSSCSKCYRTSERCEKVKTQLRHEKIQTKALKKEVAELSVTVMKKDEQLKRKDEAINEKDEEIRLLKEKLAELQQFASKTVRRPSSSNQHKEENEEDQPIRYLTPTYKNSEFSVETRAKFHEFLNIRDTHPGLERQAKKRVIALSKKAKDHGIKRMASRELIQILKSYETYFRVVEDNIKWIQKHKNDHLDKLTPLSELPKFSENFEKVYDEVVNEELSDKTCPVCIEEIEDLSETIKCKCKKRYHVHCAWDMDAHGYKCYCEERLPLD
ncbi:hypothetical protein CAEBREN_22055 [Caenorhabditis brenneri]|uniref:DUF7809 domain-containing protein n=1 Tax=Caenorhabditis brenneri TaxID=135651 RepID=G0MUF4_CAEBE|nr:hypothetical protein CAEBREN_22055 [Caenorhabditis brenneri]